MNLSANLPQDARALTCSEFLQHQNVSKLMQKLSQATDALLLQLWNESGLHHDAALLAVGGYGRGELFDSSSSRIKISMSE